jgi:hypothetical protein
MGKCNLLSRSKRISALLVLSVCSSVVFGQEVVRQDSIPVKPVEIYQLLKPACMPCHSDAGRDKPKSAVNFSAWEKYNPMEQKMLSASIQNEVKKGSMPPKGFLKSHPESVLDSLQISKISQWCDSLKARP